MNKTKTMLTIAMAMLTTSSFAQLNGSGYYRVLNEGTSRYITIIDNHSKQSTVATDVDFGALQTITGFDNVVSNPGSIIYIRKDAGVANGFSLCSQGTDTKNITGQTLTIKKSTTNSNAYWAWGSKSGMTIYLNDVIKYDDYTGLPADTAQVAGNADAKSKTRNWFILPVKVDVDQQYFGIKPEIQIGDKYYATIYAYFPFKLASAGMKAYSIVGTAKDMAAYQEITGIVPISTPVLIECTSPDPSNNRIDIVDEEVAALSSNVLKGVWFSCHTPGHINRMAYDENTMRVLGITKDGKLGFIKAPESYLKYDAGVGYLPANKAYLTVSSNTGADVRVVDLEEYQAGVHGITVDTDKVETGVYTLSGMRVRQPGETTEGLPKGVYIVNGKKVIVQ